MLSVSWDTGRGKIQRPGPRGIRQDNARRKIHDHRSQRAGKNASLCRPTDGRRDRSDHRLAGEGSTLVSSFPEKEQNLRAKPSQLISLQGLKIIR